MPLIELKYLYGFNRRTLQPYSAPNDALAVIQSVSDYVYHYDTKSSVYLVPYTEMAKNDELRKLAYTFKDISMFVGIQNGESCSIDEVPNGASPYFGLFLRSTIMRIL